MVKITKLHLIYQYDWYASTIHQKFEKITDFIHQYLIQHNTNGTEVCPVIYTTVQFKFTTFQYAYATKNIQFKLHITINLNLAFPNMLINRI